MIREALPEFTTPEAVPDIVFEGLSCDSRTIKPGDVFLAVQGAKDDGGRFIDEAVQRGAAAVIAEPATRRSAAAVPIIEIPDSRRTVWRMAAAFYEDPSREMCVTGVTGTNGKTTTTYLLEHLFRKAGRSPGVIGTVSTRFAGQEFPAVETTPGPLKLQQILSQMKKAHVDRVAMEVSSHALHQERVSGVHFTCAVFTNLTQDHLDYHGTMQAYFDCKAKLFEGLDANAAAVVNEADEWGKKLIGRTRAKIWTFGADSSHFRADAVSDTPEGTFFDLKHPGGTAKVRMSLHGSFNVLNALGAIAAASAQGVEPARSAAALADFAGVPGRMESIRLGQDFTVLVDFAHTPDGLENVLRASKGAGKLILVFGCGGDRDRKKRPQMAGIAARYADQIIVTSDNPRSEDPKAIAAEVCAGFPAGFDRYRVVLDRRKAIREALLSARTGDRVILAGKGHERAQIVGTQALPFSDREEAERVLHGR